MGGTTGMGADTEGGAMIGGFEADTARVSAKLVVIAAAARGRYGGGRRSGGSERTLRRRREKRRRRLGYVSDTNSEFRVSVGQSLSTSSFI
jgi:hypothetical protein